MRRDAAESDAAMADTAQFVGTGGVVWTLALPLSEVMLYQIAKGDLRPANDAAKAAVPDPDPDPDPEPEGDGETVVPTDVIDVDELELPPLAGPGSSRTAWANYAESVGIDVSDDDSRADIIAKVDGP